MEDRTDEPFVGEYHEHINEHGVLVKCYHRCRSVLTDYGFWLGCTISFPLEHFIWEKIPVFRDISAWMGL